MPNTQELSARVLTSDLQDAEVFEEQRQAIYAETVQDPDARAAALGRLVGGTLLKNGETTILDETLEQVTAPAVQQATEAAEHFDTVSKRILGTVSRKKDAAELVATTGYEVQVAGDGAVREVRRVQLMNQSGPKVESAMRESKRIPYGPKQNDVSFRRSEPNPNPRPRR